MVKRFDNLGMVRNDGAKPYTPVVDGRSPVSKLAREGLHNGAWQWALRKVVPWDAKRSRFGVFAIGWPPRWPIQLFWSSMAINKTFGGFAAAALTQVAT